MSHSSASKVVDSPLTLRNVIQSSYLGGDSKQWLEPSQRGERHYIYLDSVIKWNMNYAKDVPERIKTHTFRIRVYNYNNSEDKTSNYQSILLMDQLSLDAPVKFRCGGYIKYKKEMDKPFLKSHNFCGDFYFVSMNALKRTGALFGRDTTNGNFPVQMNPSGRVHLCKHLVSAVKALIKTKYFSHNDNQPREERVYVNSLK